MVFHISAVMFWPVLERLHASGTGCSKDESLSSGKNISKPNGTIHYLSSEKVYPPFAQLGPVL